CKVPEVIRFARTIETWQAPIIAALQTGLTNARTEGYNRIVSATRGRAYEWTREGRSTMSIA
ncbi:MAG: transposase, partial [Actinomycetota bacterium]|nr:transposase [Actinomycetota bacterium]